MTASNAVGSSSQTSAAVEVKDTPPAPPAPPPSPVAQVTLSLSAASKQEPNKLLLQVSCGPVPCTAKITGDATVPANVALKKRGASASLVLTAVFKLKQETVSLAANETKNVEARFKNKASVKKIKRLLRKASKKARKRAKVRATVTATDSAGTTATGNQKIKLKR